MGASVISKGHSAFTTTFIIDFNEVHYSVLGTTTRACGFTSHLKSVTSTTSTRWDSNAAPNPAPGALRSSVRLAVLVGSLVILKVQTRGSTQLLLRHHRHQRGALRGTEEVITGFQCRTQSYTWRSSGRQAVLVGSLVIL